MKTGISLYLGTGFNQNKIIIRKASAAGASFAFTSLHIPEEQLTDYAGEVKRLLAECREAGLKLLVDIGPGTLEKLGLKSFEELEKTSITHIRLDYGFSYDQMAKLSEKFVIVFNASTMDREIVSELRKRNVDFLKIAACHNFYPKKLTGLSLERISRINMFLHAQGITTMGFVAGDGILRGPMKEGLPTAEAHRTGDTILHMLELANAGTDVVMIGDIDCMASTWKGIGELSAGYVSLQAKLQPDYAYLMNTIHHDRPDSSEYVIRSQESRGYAAKGKIFEPQPVKERKIGSISIGNSGYLRYSGELEIARCDLSKEDRVNIIGQIQPDSIRYLPYITDGFGFCLRDSDKV